MSQSARASSLLAKHYRADFIPLSKGIRTVFTDLDIEESKPVHHHTHGQAASVRSTASNLIDAIVSSTGKTVEMFQGSESDILKGRNVSRTYFWAKDQVVEQPRNATPSDIVAMVDVDYYVDMPKWLLENPKPFILYTFQPSAVARDSGDYRFTFLSDGSVRYTVSGGGEYVHHVWNWDGDALRVVGYRFGLPYRVVTYGVERRHLDVDHSLVLLTPYRSYQGYCLSWLAEKFLKAKELTRLNPVDGEFTRLLINGRNTLEVSTGRVNQYVCNTVPASVDGIISITKETLSQKMTLAIVRSKIRSYNETDPVSEQGAEVLHAYHLRGSGRMEQVSVTDAVRRYQYVPKGAEVDPDARPSMVAFMSPLLDGAFAPDRCLGNDIRAAQERVEKLKSQPVVASDFVVRCITEFIGLFCGGKRNFLRPCDNDEVYRRQCRPTQIRILDHAQHELPSDKTSVFVKAEAYGTANDPRMISTICGPTKMAYSSYVYPVADYLKKMDWYAFGKTPVEIATRVAEICLKHQNDWVDVTDFSRMDGRVSNIARRFERQLMLTMYDSKYHAELNQLMRSQCSLQAVTKHGYRYNTGLARASGSPETSAFNTLLTAFTCYMAYRRQSDGMGGYVDPLSAWNSLGIYGGDDGLSGGLVRVHAERSARSVGQVLNLIRVSAREPGVKFLARCYGPDVWFGDRTSCCDLKRQLAKFHVTARLPSNVTPARKLSEKAFAFSLTDRNTPVIGPFVLKALKLYPYTAKDFQNLIGMWNVELDSEVQYPNEYGEWMVDLLHEQIPTFDHDAFEAWLDTADCDTIFTPPNLAERPEAKVKSGVVAIDGDLVTPSKRTCGSKPSTGKGVNPTKRKKAVVQPKRKQKRPNKRN